MEFRRKTCVVRDPCAEVGSSIHIARIPFKMEGMPKASDVAIIVPTLNAAAEWPRLTSALLSCVQPEQVLVIDSSSTDGTADLARRSGFQVFSIPRTQFNHGGTRQLATELLRDAPIFIYLTQDAELTDSDAVNKLLEAFADPNVGAAYGRQLPKIDAGPIEAHARLFNYPQDSSVRDLKDREILGLKTAFISNSFAAYRATALAEAGGFPNNVIFGEDTVTVGKLLLKGWKIAYVADACVYHSHTYTLRQEFKRYFDIGVLHARESWLLVEFGRTGSEGLRFVLSELRYLWPRKFFLIPSAVLRTSVKLLAYKLGKMESKLNLTWKRRLSMDRDFWSEDKPSGGLG